MYYMKPKNKTASVLQSLPDCFSNLFKVDYKKEILFVMSTCFPSKNRKPGTYLSLLVAKLSVPLQTSTMENLEFAPIDNWTEYHAQIQETEKSWNSSIHQLIQDYHGVPCGLLIIGIPLHILGIIQHVFIVIYERYEMDSMKRSLTNQVNLSFLSSAQFLIAFFYR